MELPCMLKPPQTEPPINGWVLEDKTIQDWLEYLDWRQKELKRILHNHRGNFWRRYFYPELPPKTDGEE